MKALTVFALIAALALLASCSRSKPEPVPEKSPEKSAEPESRVKHGTNGEIVVTVDAATQKIIGLQTAALESGQLPPEVKAYGRVLDASPLAALVAEWSAAHATSDASQAELKRLKTLVEQDNASQRALQTEEAAAARDSALAESTRLKLLANWGVALAERKNMPDLVRSLSALSASLVELEVPAGTSLAASPIGAQLVTLAESDKTIEAQLLGPSSMVDPQLQGVGFLLLVSPNAAHLAPGAAVAGFLILPGQPDTGVILPRDAVVRFNGETWVYVQTGEVTFERKAVVLEAPLEKGWFVRKSLKPGDKVVTVGAQQLLSEELKGAGGEE